MLEQVRSGELPVDEASTRLRSMPFEDLGFAQVDHHRALRCGFPEVIFCTGKTDEQVAAIAERIVASGSDLLATRATPAMYEAVTARCSAAEYYQEARAIVVQDAWQDRGTGEVLVVSAGTSDIPVAEEAAVTARVLGNRVERVFDVGVAGIHRLLDARERLLAARVVIVAAGMEGALPSVVGGLVSAPVVAVPTSVGYGASFGGVAALLGMLNSCASNVSVVNSDNGYGAGFVASLINRL